MFVISVHGRSGQGVETAISSLAKAALSSDLYAQAVFFPSQERKGSYVWGLVKMDKNPIPSKQLEHPDIALVFNTNLDIKAIVNDVKEKGISIFNTSEKIAMPVMKKKKIKSYSVDATGIAMRTINKPIPNMAMLGAVVKYFNKLTLKSVKAAIASMEKENAVAVEEGFKMVK